MSRDVKIVIVDDEKCITDVFFNILSLTFGESNIKAFNNPIEAEKYINDNYIDALITDYKMPWKNGLDLIEAVDQDCLKIMVSGYVSEIARDRLERNKIYFYEKPVPLRELAIFIKENV